MNNTTPQGQPAALPGVAVPTGSVIYCVAVILTRLDGDKTEIAQTMSWRSNCTEDEARGAAVAYAFEQRPGFSIDLVTVARIEIPSPNTPGEPRGSRTHRCSAE